MERREEPGWRGEEEAKKEPGWRREERRTLTITTSMYRRWKRRMSSPPDDNDCGSSARDFVRNAASDSV